MILCGGEKKSKLKLLESLEMIHNKIQYTFFFTQKSVETPHQGLSLVFAIIFFLDKNYEIQIGGWVQTNDFISERGDPHSD